MIYENVAQLCKRKGISIAKLEKELSIGNGTIGRWEKSSPTIDNLKKVADYFGVTVDELIAAGNADAGASAS